MEPSAVHSGEPGIWAEIAAMQMTLLALIETHPDREALRQAFDMIVSGLQMHNAAAGGPKLAESNLLSVAIDRYREQLARGSTGSG